MHCYGLPPSPSSSLLGQFCSNARQFSWSLLFHSIKFIYAWSWNPPHSYSKCLAKISKNLTYLCTLDKLGNFSWGLKIAKTLKRPTAKQKSEWKFSLVHHATLRCTSVLPSFTQTIRPEFIKEQGQVVGARSKLEAVGGFYRWQV